MNFNLKFMFLVPGAINRFPGLNEDTKVTDGGSPDDVILRSFDGSQEKVENENSTTTTTTSTTTEEPIQKRSIDDSVILTRKGVYRVLESRLTA
jgi:hypothetical protein